MRNMWFISPYIIEKENKTTLKTSFSTPLHYTTFASYHTTTHDMKRILHANWQFHLLSTLAKGSFAITPELAAMHLEQVSNLITQGHLGGAKPESIDDEMKFMAFSGVGPAIMGDLSKAPDGSIAVVPLMGTMLKYGTWCTYGTEEIAAALDYAASFDNISGIVLNIDSGGGAVDAIAPMLQAIQRAQAQGKPVVASVDLCCSAAYYTASACDSIIANNNISSMIGSIGVMCSFADYKKYYEDKGIKLHTIFSSHSADKNKNFIDATDGKYENFIKEELDPLALDFQNAVKANRGDILQADTPGLLNGKVYYANTAKQLGLIDKVGTFQDAIKEAASLVMTKAFN